MTIIHKFQQLYLFPDDPLYCRKLSETGPVLLEQLRKILSIVDLVTVLPLQGNDILKEMNIIADEEPDKGIFLTGSLLTEDSLLKSSFEKSNQFLLILTIKYKVINFLYFTDCILIFRCNYDGVESEQITPWVCSAS